MPGRYSPQGNYGLTLSEVLSQYIIDYPVLRNWWSNDKKTNNLSYLYHPDNYKEACV